MRNAYGTLSQPVFATAVVYPPADGTGASTALQSYAQVATVVR